MAIAYQDWIAALLLRAGRRRNRPAPVNVIELLYERCEEGEAAMNKHLYGRSGETGFAGRFVDAVCLYLDRQIVRSASTSA